MQEHRIEKDCTYWYQKIIILLYESPLAETRLTVYRQRQVKSNTGAVVASWDPDWRATIGENDMKNKGFDEN